MSTTAVFVELFVGGIQASIWISLLVLSFSGTDWLTTSLPQTGRWDAIITVMLFAGWYSLGIIVDRFARVLYMVYDPAKIMKNFRFVKKQLAKTASSSTRVEVITKSGEVYEYLEYFRSRARIVRATVFNTIFTTISAEIFIFSQCKNLNCNTNQIALTAVLIGILAFIGASIASGMLELAYEERVIQAQRTLKDSTNTK